MLRAIVLAIALLLAQHSALSHALWHFDPGHSHDEGQEQLCPLHAALGTVAGAVDAALPQVFLQDAAASRPQAPRAEAPGLSAPTPSSRDPPAIPLK